MLEELEERFRKLWESWCWHRSACPPGAGTARLRVWKPPAEAAPGPEGPSPRSPSVHVRAGLLS